MSIKTQLLNMLSKFENETISLHQEVAEIQKDTKISSHYRDTLMSKQLEKYKAIGASYTPLFESLVNQAINKHKDTIKDRMADNDYQLKLSNALKMIELGGEDLEQVEVDMIVEPFTEDEVAKKVLSKLIKETRSDYSLEVLMNPGLITKSIEVLEKVKENLITLTTPHELISDVDHAELIFFSMKDGLELFDNSMLWTPNFSKEF